MARCLRCGAGAEWIEGRVRKEPDHQFVTIPDNEDEAALMVLLGTSWLKEHAPHRLKSSEPGVPDDGR